MFFALELSDTFPINSQYDFTQALVSCYKYTLSKELK